MPTNRRILSQDAAVSAGDADAAQGLVLHLDANDEDSIESGGANQGNGSGDWFDIANHDLNVPLIDKGTDLVLHLNASDTNSYESGDGAVWTDLSSDGNNGAIDGATFGSDTRGYFTFDGTNDEVEVSADTDLSNNANNFSAEVWFNADSVSGTEYIFYQNNGTAGATHQFIIWRSSANVYIYIYGSSNTTLESLGGFTQGEWTHVAFTFDGSNVKGYVNGTLKQTTARTANANTSTDGEIYLGSNGSGNYFTGKIAVARYYKTALTESEVAQNFRANCFLSYSSIYSTNLQANLDAGDTTTLTASTWSDKANSNNGTFNNFSSTLSDFYDKELGNWIDFDGTNDYLEIPASTNLDIGSGGFTYETWLLNEKSSGTSSVISNLHNVSGYTGYTLRINNGTDVNLFIYNNTALIFDQTASSSVTTNTWTHLAFTVASASSGAAVKLYINGILSSVSGTLSGAYGGSGQNIQAGQYPFAASGRYFNGKMGVLKFHSEELTAAEIAQNYLATKNDYPNGINGDIQGPTFQGSATPYHFDFNGSDNYVDVAYTTLGDRDFTVTMYIKFDDLTAQRYIFTKYLGNPSGQYGMLIQSQASASIILWQMFDTGNTAAINLNSSTSLSTGTYYHLAFVYVKETSGTIYVDGSSDGTTSWTTGNPFGQNSAQVRFARYQSTLTSLDGEIGQIKIFDKALSASEVLAEYNATKTPYE